MCNDFYCRECGCEIRNSMDIGMVDIEVQSRSVFPGCKEKEYIKKPFVICQSCLDETERQWEEFKKTPEYEYECSFIRFCRQFDEGRLFDEVIGWQVTA